MSWRLKIELDINLALVRLRDSPGLTVPSVACLVWGRLPAAPVSLLPPDLALSWPLQWGHGKRGGGYPHQVSPAELSPSQALL